MKTGQIVLWINRRIRQQCFPVLLALALQGCDKPNSLKNQAFGVRLGMSHAEVAHAVDSDVVPDPSVRKITVHDKRGIATLNIAFNEDRAESITAVLHSNDYRNESLDTEGLWKWFCDLYSKDLGSPDTVAKNSVSWDFKRPRRKHVCVSHDTVAITITLQIVDQNSAVPVNAGRALQR